MSRTGYRQIKRAVLLAVVVLALSAGEARAHTTIIAPANARWPYQQWVDRAHTPTPDTTVTVSETDSPCGVYGAFGCTNEVDHIDMGYGGRRLFFHELGHIWDELAMQPWQRTRFLTLIHHTTLPWDSPDGANTFAPSGAAEWFADAYSVCARVAHIPPRVPWNIGDGVVGGPAMAITCRMVRRSNPSTNQAPGTMSQLGR